MSWKQIVIINPKYANSYYSFLSISHILQVFKLLEI